MTKDGKKKCWDCKTIFDANTLYFYQNVSNGDGLSSECRECKKKYSIKRGRILQQLRIEFIKSVGSKCMKCGFYCKDSSLFDIDHIIPVFKTKEKRGLPLVYSIDRFQVLCPNCHRLKTIYENRKRGLWKKEGPIV